MTNLQDEKQNFFPSASVTTTTEPPKTSSRAETSTEIQKGNKLTDILKIFLF